ncbi:unnamed protein product [Colias eurytheme]|nr:unnamed protein product [Colias eurytheme]
MKATIVIIFFAAFAATATVQSQAIDLAEAETGYAAGYAAGAEWEAVRVVSVVSAARQNICTALLCHNVCISLGFRTGSCNLRLECVCRRW